MRLNIKNKIKTQVECIWAVVHKYKTINNMITIIEVKEYYVKLTY